MNHFLRKSIFIIVFLLGSIFLAGCDTQVDTTLWGLSSNTITVSVGDEHQINLNTGVITLDEFTYTLSNQGVIAVSATGLVEALAVGTTEITISYKKDPTIFSVSLTITVQTPSPTSVILTGSSEVVLGSTLALTASVVPTGALQTVTFSSSDETVATVSNNGVVTPVKTGSVTINAYSTNQTIFASKQITVLNAPATGVSIVGNNQVYLGQTLALSATVAPIHANQTITWTSSNDTIASVSTSGVVTPNQAGSVVIRAASVVSTIFDELTITILVPVPTSVGITGPSSVVISNTITLTATVLPSQTNQSVTWLSSDETVASVNQSGVVTGLVSGVTTIRATASNGVYQEYQINVVLPNPTSVEIIGTTSVPLNQPFTYSVNVLPLQATQGVVWTSSNASVALIDQDGLLTPLSKGTTSVRATAINGVYQEIVVTIVDAIPLSVVISGQTSVLLGTTITLTSVVSPSEALQTVIWTSSNTNIATISNTGVVTPKNNGVVTIKATSSLNAEAFGEYEITVTRPDATSVMVEGYQFMFEGASAEFTAFVFPGLALQSVDWTSSNEAVATVNDEGLVIGVAAGDVIITARASETVFYDVALSVKPVTSEFYVDPAFAGRYGETEIDGYAEPVYLGLNGYATISEAVNAIPSGLNYASVSVAAGNYPQSFLINTSHITIVGPNYGINPNSGLRGPEAVISGTVVLGFGTHDLEDISIGGFKFTSGAQIIQANNVGVDLFDFMFNIVENITYTTSVNQGFIQFVSPTLGKGVKNSYIAYNLFHNIYSSVSSNVLVRPIWMEYATDVYITENTFTNFERDNYFKDLSGDLTISDNQFENTKYRFIHVNGFFGGFITIINNTMTTSLDAAVAIYGRLEYEPGMTIQVLHNNITNVNRGVYVDPEYSVAGAWVVGNPVYTAVNYNIIVVSHATNYWAQGSDLYGVDFNYNYWGVSTPTSDKFVNVPLTDWQNYYATSGEVPGVYDIEYSYPDSIQITNQPSVINIGTSIALEVSYLPIDVSVHEIVWVSSNPSIVSVNADGLLEAHLDGTVTITAYAWFNRHVNVSFTLVSDYAPGIALAFDHMDSLFVVGDTFTISTTPYPTIYSQEVVTWVSSNEAIATVSNVGAVAIVGVGDVTITARFASNNSVSHSMSFRVSEVNNLNNLMDKLAAVQYASTQAYNFTVWGSTTYAHSTLKSVSLYYFGANPVNQSIINISQYTRYGRNMSALPVGITQYNPQNIHWVVIHDTGNSSPGSGALSHSNYLHNLTNNPSNTTYVSWHYTVDDALIYQHIPNTERAFHAGDGSTLVGEHLTRLGGGNTNGIGIEMAIGRGYDIYRVWQKSAKLAANLAVQYNLPVSHIKYHNDFSGKDCPQTLRKSGLITQFEIMTAIEYEIAKYHPTAFISFESHSPRYLDSTGRVLELPTLGTTVSYTITISENGNNVSRTFNTYLPGKLF